MPSVSVVIPTYNVEKYLRRTLQSVMEQTQTPDEILLIDDGSTDNTIKVAEEFSVRVLTQANKGAGAARNFGINTATGDWIAFLDGDDEWLPTRIEELKKAIQANPSVILVANDEFEGPEGGPWQFKPLHEKYDSTRSFFPQIFRRSFLSTSAVAVNRQTLLEVGGFDETLPSAQDFDLWLRLALKGDLHFIPRPLSRYLLRPDSISTRPYQRLQCTLRILKKHTKRVTPRLFLLRNLLAHYEVMQIFRSQNSPAEALKIMLLYAPFNTLAAMKFLMKEKMAPRV